MMDGQTRYLVNGNWLTAAEMEAMQSPRSSVDIMVRIEALLERIAKALEVKNAE